MGYVHDTDLCKFIAPNLIIKTEGTWVINYSAGKVSDNRTAGAASCTLLVPINPLLIGSSKDALGAKVKSIDIWYEVSVAALTSFATVSLVKMALNATGVAPSVTSPTLVVDADHDTSAERLAVGVHKMNVSLDVEEFVGDDVAFWLGLTFVAAATSVFKLYGAQTNYDLKL